MADRSRNRNRRIQSNRWDDGHINNWTTQRYIEELAKLGIRVPSNIGKVVMKKLYLENQGMPPANSSDARININSGDGENTNAASDPPSAEPIPEANSRPTETARLGVNVSQSGSGSSPSFTIQSGSSANSSNMVAATMNNDIVCSMLNTMQSMQQTVLGLQNTVMTLVSEKRKEKYDHTSCTLDTAMAAIRQQASPTSSTCTAGGYTLPRTEFGVPSESLLHLDIVSEKLRKKIWEGKDVNMAELLIPKFESDKPNNITINLIKQEDQRLHRRLSIAEFITAFGKYKRVMCQRYPERRVELDRYEAIIVDIHNVYGGKFYDYHCQFSSRAATALRDNVKIDWSMKDLGLLMMVVGNATANKCSTCTSSMHLSAFCPQGQQNNYIPVIGQNVQNNPTNRKTTDKYGRKRTIINSKEVCNNFNENKCFKSNCQFEHICTACHENDHGSSQCKTSQRNPSQSRK